MLLVARSRLMCCSRLEGQAEAAPTLAVVRHADDAAGHFPEVLLAGGQETAIGPAVRERNAQRLGLTDHDVHTERAGRLEDGTTDRIHRRDGKRSDLVRGLDHIAQRLNAAEEVRRLHDDGRGPLIQRVSQRGQVRQAVFDLHPHKLHRMLAKIRLEHRQRVGMNGPGHEHARPLIDRAGHQHRLGHGAGLLVQRGVGHVHAGKLAEQGLIFEKHLERTLRRLCLVRRVGGAELRLVGQLFHDGRDEVVRGAAPEKADQLLTGGVLFRQGADVGQQFHFAQAGRDVQGTGQTLRGGHVAKQILDLPDADDLEHLPNVRFGKLGIVHEDEAQSRWLPATGILYTLLERTRL